MLRVQQLINSLIFFHKSHIVARVWEPLSSMSGDEQWHLSLGEIIDE